VLNEPIRWVELAKAVEAEASFPTKNCLAVLNDLEKVHLIERSGTLSVIWWYHSDNLRGQMDTKLSTVVRAIDEVDASLGSEGLELLVAGSL
jgi:hypothetical protein